MQRRVILDVSDEVVRAARNRCGKMAGQRDRGRPCRAEPMRENGGTEGQLGGDQRLRSYSHRYIDQLRENGGTSGTSSEPGFDTGAYPAFVIVFIR